ncbi:MAG: fibronectin type III domain-containing protein [Marmoricola sp.]
MRTRLVAAGLLACALTLAPLPVLLVAQASAADAASQPDPLLPGGGSGQAALDDLGPQVPEAAALNGISSTKLTHILSTDDTANLDENGRLYYVDPAGPPPTKLGGSKRAQSSVPDPGAPQQSGVPIPALHSQASSTHKIYLDFDGYTLPSQSFWTQGASPIPAGTYTGFTLDGDPSSFTSAEITYIQTVWRIVSEKYSAYDVDVTTVDPGDAGVTRANAGDTTYGDHVVITDDPAPVAAVCNNACAGIAYLNTFNGPDTNSEYEPIWVFSSKTYGLAQGTGLDAAHEVGHSFGLSHDGTNAQGSGSYDLGHANWVPIMGITNQNAVSQFSKGEYSDANNVENDLAIIGSRGNSGAANSLLLPDDYATTGSAPSDLGDHPSYALDGVISNAADDDLFSIPRTCTSALTVTATGIGSGQALDIKLDILDSSNNVLATADPPSGQTQNPAETVYQSFIPTGLDATTSLPTTTAGSTYRIRVDGVGYGTGITGYTDYGSIGQYHLTITGCPATNAPGAPASITATPGAIRTTTGTISWTAPASNGGSTITGYQITGLPGGTVNVGNQLSYNATGLTPGTTYNVGVAAVNSNGPGAVASTTLRDGTWAPQTKPGLTASAVGSTITLSWTAPANPGNATQTGWHLVGSGPSGSTIDSVINNPAILTTQITAPFLGSYSFTITGTYTADDTAGIVASDPATATATTTPGAPATFTTAPDSRATTGTLSWTAPASNGGSPITGYKITGLPGGTVTLGNQLTYSAVNLVPGTTYSLDLQALNANGAGTTKSATIKVLTWAPTTKPGLTATLSGSTATVTWTAPANPGGATLTGWHVVGTGASPVDETLPAGTLTKDYTVATGTTTFTVTGVYTASDTGGVVASDPAGVTATSTPGAPASASSSPDSRATTGTISWTAPTDNGGSAITGYKVSGLPGGPVTLSNVLTYPATNLVPGTTYTVDVQAINANGPGAARTTSIRVLTWAPQGKPGLTVTRSGTTATLTWTAPANPGKATLTGWHVLGSGPGNTIDDTIASPTTLTKSYPGLAAGTQSFTVVGTYAADDNSPVASDPKSVTVFTAPGAPASVTTTPHPRTTTGTVSWTAPTTTGGSPITGYIVSGLPAGAVAVGNVLTYDIPDLDPGTTYTIAVAAVNDYGTGATATAALKVVTWAPLTKPALSATLSGSTATLTWTEPANPGNATLTGWHVVGTGASPVDATLDASVLTMNYPVSLGTTTFTVTGVYTASDIAGVVASDPASVTVSSTPGAPASASTSPDSRATTGTISWTAPTDNGGSAITGYRLTGLPTGTVNVGASVLTYGATGLVPGTTYTVGIAAANTNGLGATRTTTLRVQTWVPTAAPGLSVTKVGTTATLTWTEAANPGNATLTGWLIHRTGPGVLPADKTLPAPVAGNTTTMTGLNAGTHDFTVTPTYTADDTAGLQGSATKSVTITTAPGAPATASTTPDSRATTGTISWTAPTDNGGSPVTGYTVTGLPTGTVTVGNLLTLNATNLVPGTTYNLTVAAINAVGTGPTTATTIKVLTWAPTTKPGLTATASGGTITVSWTAPANPGGATLTGWHVVGTGTSPVDETLPAGTLTKDYSASNGTTTFTVTGVYTASDIAGVVASDPKSATVSSASGAPGSVTATSTPRTTNGTVTWTAATDNGGSAITGYKVSGLPGGPATPGNVLTYAATNLVPGTTYTVGVQAINANGPGTAATTTLTVDTWAPTAKPGLTASITGATATLTWTAPTNPGGAVLTGWHLVGTGVSPVDITYGAGTLTTDLTVGIGTTTYTVTGTYTATDVAGIVSSDPKSVVRGASAPGTPASASATPDVRSTTGTVSWTAPSSDGGSPVTGYQLTGLPGGTVTLGNVLTYPATGLVPGTTYTVGVKAINAVGTGASAATTTLKVATWAPLTKPGLTATISGSTATLTWTAPANPGGAVLTGWHVVGTGVSPVDITYQPGTLTTGLAVAVGTTTYTVTGTYTATDVAGVVASDPKSVVRPPLVITKASAPIIGTASSGARRGAKNATVRWGAPTSNGNSAITAYRVIAYKIVRGKVTRTLTSTARPASARSYVWALAGGSYKFRVVAYNAMGVSPYSGYSRVVLSR